MLIKLYPILPNVHVPWSFDFPLLKVWWYLHINVSHRRSQGICHYCLFLWRSWPPYTDINSYCLFLWRSWPPYRDINSYCLFLWRSWPPYKDINSYCLFLWFFIWTLELSRQCGIFLVFSFIVKSIVSKITENVIHSL